MQVDNATTADGACVVLHNICELFSDYRLEEWEQINLDEDDIVSVQHNCSSRQAASTIRDAINKFTLIYCTNISKFYTYKYI